MTSKQCAWTDAGEPCPENRYCKRKYCATHDEARRLQAYGLCTSCSTRAVWCHKTGRCAACDQQQRRKSKARKLFVIGAPRTDQVLSLIETMIARMILCAPAYARYLDSGQGSGEPQVIEMQTYLHIARGNLSEAQQNYIVVHVNRAVGPGERLPRFRPPS